MSGEPVLLHSARGVTLLGGGALGAADLGLALRLAPDLVAADGAAAAALAAGLVPQAVIGDLDSLDPASAARLPPGRVHRIAEQSSTDFDKCLRSIRAPLILGVGFMGARLDHELAALNTLARRPWQRCLLLGPADLCFHAPPALALDLPRGTRLSLFPVARLGVRGSGLAWPVGGLAFAPDGRIGTSNAVSGPVRLRFERPGMLVMLPRAHLETGAAALLGSTPWPEPAPG